jgi:hypothetical protein
VPGRILIATLLLIAAFKARLVVVHFMELNSNGRGWRLAFELFLAAYVVSLLILYLSAPG